MIPDEATRKRQAAEDAAVKKAIDTQVRSILEPDFAVYTLTVVPHREKGMYEVRAGFTIKAEAARRLVE